MKSKTEATYFPQPRSSYEDANTLPFEVDGGAVTFSQAFKYLGNLVTSNLDYSAEEDARFNAASAAFASLRIQLFGCKLNTKTMPTSLRAWCAYYVHNHLMAHERVLYNSSGTRVSLRPETPRRNSCTAQTA